MKTIKSAIACLTLVVTGSVMGMETLSVQQLAERTVEAYDFTIEPKGVPVESPNPNQWRIVFTPYESLNDYGNADVSPEGTAKRETIKKHEHVYLTAIQQYSSKNIANFTKQIALLENSAQPAIILFNHKSPFGHTRQFELRAMSELLKLPKTESSTHFYTATLSGNTVTVRDRTTDASLFSIDLSKIAPGKEFIAVAIYQKGNSPFAPTYLAVLDTKLTAYAWRNVNDLIQAATN